MPNWDRYCTACGFEGSYLDFRPATAEDEDEDGNTRPVDDYPPGAALDPEDQACDRAQGCGRTVRWEDDDEDDEDSEGVYLDRIAGMLSGTRWDGAADLLEAIAQVVRESGRAIAEARDGAPSWRTRA